MEFQIQDEFDWEYYDMWIFLSEEQLLSPVNRI